jgi:excisionase family DNA binding protein
MKMLQNEQERPDRLAYSIQDAAHILSVSQNHIRNLLKNKTLERVRVGRRVTITAASLRRLVESGGTVDVADVAQQSE